MALNTADLVGTEGVGLYPGDQHSSAQCSGPCHQPQGRRREVGYARALRGIAMYARIEHLRDRHAGDVARAPDGGRVREQFAACQRSETLLADNRRLRNENEQASCRAGNRLRRPASQPVTVRPGPRTWRGATTVPTRVGARAGAAVACQTSKVPTSSTFRVPRRVFLLTRLTTR